jgi:hypoxanthine phosphoribosyltransferase
VVRITQDLSKPVVGRDVLIVEDIVDTGLTLGFLLDSFQARQPRSVKVCALLSKPLTPEGGTPVDYVGFFIDDRFVVGYGLDFEQRYRNLPYIAWLKTPQPA